MQVWVQICKIPAVFCVVEKLSWSWGTQTSVQKPNTSVCTQLFRVQYNIVQTAMQQQQGQQQQQQQQILHTPFECSMHASQDTPCRHEI